MRFLKGLLGFLAVLAIIYFVAECFASNDYAISETITINKPKQAVYDYIKVLDNQRNYSVWVMADKEMVPAITGTDGTVGAMQSWDSKDKNVGKGSQTITELGADTMKVALNFEKPMKATAEAANVLKEKDANTCELTSIFYGHSSFPGRTFEKLMTYIFVGPSEKKNLENIKSILEGGKAVHLK